MNGLQPVAKLGMRGLNNKCVLVLHVHVLGAMSATRENGGDVGD